MSKPFAISISDLINDPLEFDVWIKSFKTEKDSLGDLARDYISDLHRRDLEEKDPISLEQSLFENFASCDAYTAFEYAQIKYKEYLKEFNMEKHAKID